MAKVVIAGQANCPYYARIELLGDMLVASLPDFKLHKIILPPTDWKVWVEELCQRNNWDRRKSPVVWRELVDRGGKGVLIGGANEFQEYAKEYYGVQSRLVTDDMLKISSENSTWQSELQAEDAYFDSLRFPLKLTITGAAQTNTVPIVLYDIGNGKVFGKREIAVTLYDSVDHFDELETIKSDVDDMAVEFISTVQIISDLEAAFEQADAILMLDRLNEVQLEVVKKKAMENVEEGGSVHDINFFDENSRLQSHSDSRGDEVADETENTENLASSTHKSTDKSRLIKSSTVESYELVEHESGREEPPNAAPEVADKSKEDVDLQNPDNNLLGSATTEIGLNTDETTTNEPESLPDTSKGVKSEQQDLEDRKKPTLFQLPNEEDNDTKIRKAILLEYAKIYKDYGAYIQKNANKNCRIVVAGDGPINTCALVLANEVDMLPKSNILPLSRFVENQAKGVLAQRLKTNSAGMSELLIWGNLNQNFFADTRKTIIYGHNCSIKGPPFYHVDAEDFVYDKKWHVKNYNKEIIDRSKKLQDLLQQGARGEPPVMSHAFALTTFLHDWFEGAASNHISSLAIYSDGKLYGVPEGIYFSLPARMKLPGIWSVAEDVELSDEVVDAVDNCIKELLWEKCVVYPELKEMYFHIGGDDLKEEAAAADPVLDKHELATDEENEDEATDTGAGVQGDDETAASVIEVDNDLHSVIEETSEIEDGD